MSLESAVLDFAAFNLEKSGGFGPPKLINLVVWRLHAIRRVIELLHLRLLNTLNAGHSLVIILASSFFWTRNHKALVILLVARLSWNCFRRFSWTIAVFRLRFFQLLCQMRIVIIILSIFHRCNDNEQVWCNLVDPALHWLRIWCLWCRWLHLTASGLRRWYPQGFFSVSVSLPSFFFPSMPLYFALLSGLFNLIQISEAWSKNVG